MALLAYFYLAKGGGVNISKGGVKVLKGGVTVSKPFIYGLLGQIFSPDCQVRLTLMRETGIE